MIAVVSHAKFTSQNFNDAGARPNLAAKAIGFRTMPEKIGDQPFLLLSQLRVRATGPREKGLASSVPSARQPLTYRALRCSQGLSDLAFGPAMLGQIPRPKAAPFAPIMGLLHTS